MRPADDARFRLPTLDAPQGAAPHAEGAEGARSLRVSAGATARCPLCGAAGEATNLFKGVYMCMADPCTVWTFEAPGEVGPSVRDT